MYRHYLLGLLSGICLSSSLLAQQAKAPSPRPATHTAAEIARSTWDSKLGKVGLTEDLFIANHLSRLNRDEITNVTSAIWGDGFGNGYKIGADSVFPTCGPQTKTPDLSTVKLYLDNPDDTDADIASGLRQQLRAIPDIRIVFSESDADATIHVLALRDKLKDSSDTIGYTLSYFASRPCSIPLAGNKFNFDINLSSDLQTAASLDVLLKEVVSEIDIRINEKIRGWNAAATAATKAQEK